MEKNPFGLLDVKDAADVLCINHKTLRRMIWRGDITYVKIGYRVMLRFSDLEEYVNARTERVLPKPVRHRTPTYAEQLAEGDEIRSREK